MDFSFERCKSKTSEDKINTHRIKEIKDRTFEKLNTAKMSKIRLTISNAISKYGKIAASGIVVLAMAVACIVSLVQRNQEANQPVGVIMSMSNVASGAKAFGGKTFGATILTYEDMVQANYDSEQLAQLELAEQQIEAILASVNVDKKDSATLSERTGEETAVVETPLVVETTINLDGSINPGYSSTATASPSVAPIYATADGNYESYGEFLLTGYCACPICCGAWSNIESPITASGAIAAAGRTVAADTSIFGFGTQLLINGQLYTVEDRGSAIKGNHIDIFFSTHQEALDWGKRYATVYKKIN